MICYRKYILRVGELWFDEDPTPCNVDVLKFRQRSVPIPGSVSSEKWSIQIDLRQDAQCLFSGFKKETQHKARRALEKDEASFFVFSGHDTVALERFCDFYRAFAQAKGLPQIDPWYLKLYGDSSALVLTCVRSGGDDLAWHSYIVCNHHARQLQSASVRRASGESSFNQMVGRCNRFLSWQDMLYFKQQSCVRFDLGGWYAGHDDTQRLGINKFKEEFGGEIVRLYDCYLGVSLPGKIAVTMKKILS